MKGTAINGMRGWPVWEVALLWLMIALALWPVWANAYFLTNDGPCHLYNARVLRDMLLGQETGFYGDWYALNPDIEPNWLNHFLLAAFQLVLSPIVSEKLFLTLYIVGFAHGFRYLARSIFPSNGSLVFLAFPFVFHKVFLMGFFNFSASVVLFFWLVGYWLRHGKQAGWKSRIAMGALMLLLLLAHPVSYCMAMGVIAFQWLGEVTVTWLSPHREARRPLLGVALATGLVAMPSLCLLLAFLLRQGGQVVASQASFHTLFHSFLELKALVILQSTEKPFPILLSLLIGTWMLAGFLRIRRLPKGHLGILLLFFLSIYAYFTQPEQVGGVGIVADRLQFYPYLIALCWLATQAWPGWLLKGAAVLGVGIWVALFAVRLHSFSLASAAVEEVVSAHTHMRPYTSVLMLSYGPEGRLPHDGDFITKETHLFRHIAEYLGTLQPHIILNNYEAHTKWFPLRWKPGRDPYELLSEGPGFEGWLPTVDFENFRNLTGKDVDYVLTWCLTEELRQFDGVKLMMGRLNRDYEEVYVSEGERVRLFERKPRGAMVPR